MYDNVGEPRMHYAKLSKQERKDKYCMVSLTCGN